VLCVARLTNEGLAAARNHALDHVDTEWILFIDADVLPDDAFLARLTDVLNGSQANGVGFNVREHHRQSDWDFYRACERDVFNNVQGRAEWVSGLLCAYRADTLRAVNGFDPAFRTRCWLTSHPRGKISSSIAGSVRRALPQRLHWLVSPHALPLRVHRKAVDRSL